MHKAEGNKSLSKPKYSANEKSQPLKDGRAVRNLEYQYNSAKKSGNISCADVKNYTGPGLSVLSGDKELKQVQQKINSYCASLDNLVSVKASPDSIPNGTKNATINLSETSTQGTVLSRGKRFISSLFNAYDSVTSAVVDESKLAEEFADRVIPSLYNATQILNETLANGIDMGINEGRVILQNGMGDLLEIAGNVTGKISGIESMVENATQVIYSTASAFSDDFERVKSEVGNTSQSIFAAAAEGQSDLKKLLWINSAFVVSVALICIIGTFACQIKKKKHQSIEISIPVAHMDESQKQFMEFLRQLILDSGQGVKYKVASSLKKHTLMITSESPIMQLMLERLITNEGHQESKVATLTDVVSGIVLNGNSDSAVIEYSCQTGGIERSPSRHTLKSDDMSAQLGRNGDVFGSDFSIYEILPADQETVV